MFYNKNFNIYYILTTKTKDFHLDRQRQAGSPQALLNR